MGGRCLLGLIAVQTIAALGVADSVTFKLAAKRGGARGSSHGHGWQQR